MDAPAPPQPRPPAAGAARELTLDELRREHARLSLALESSHMSVWDADIASGELHLSAGWASLIGGSPGPTLIALDQLMAMVHPQDLADLKRISSETIRGVRAEYSVEHRVRAVGGHWKWILSRGRVTHRDAQGRALRMSGTNLDITERKEMEARLSLAFLENEAVFETTPTALIVVRDRVIQRCNRAMEQMFGVARGELIGRSTRQLFADEAAWLSAGERAYAAVGLDQTFRDDIEFVRANGERFWAVATGRLVAPDQPDAVFAYMDVTAQKHMAQALAAAKEAADAASQAKSAFLATMSHEIRTPMNGVLGMLELLELTELEREQRETLTLAHESAIALLRLIDDILDFSKIEAGQLEIQPEILSLSSLANHSATVYLELASRKGLPLECHVEPGIAPAHVADGLRVSQIINNLLSNAIKFTASGRVSLRVDTLGREADMDLVRFRVSDTGIGVTDAQKERLFQPFVQGDSQTTRRFGGSGLGLSICKRLAELMGGSIAMDSVPGEGTTITVILRLPVADPAALASRSEARIERLAALRAAGTREAAIAPRAGAPRLLLVEDHPVNLSLLRRQVGLLGYEADVAHDGAEALEKWQTGSYGLVLTDCHMPRMDGYELARSIRRIEASRGTTATVPIVACTANALSGDADLCFQAGMSDYLPKPLTLAALKAKLERWAQDAPSSDNAREDTVSTEPEAAGLPALTPGALDQYTGGDADVAREIYAQFLASSRSDAEKLGAAMTAGDLDAVMHSSHRIKGASRMVGASPMAEAAERIEHAARAGDWDTIRASRGEFDVQYTRLIEALTAIT